MRRTEQAHDQRHVCQREIGLEEHAVASAMFAVSWLLTCERNAKARGTGIGGRGGSGAIMGRCGGEQREGPELDGASGGCSACAWLQRRQALILILMIVP